MVVRRRGAGVQLAATAQGCGGGADQHRRRRLAQRNPHLTDQRLGWQAEVTRSRRVMRIVRAARKFASGTYVKVERGSGRPTVCVRAPAGGVGDVQDIGLRARRQWHGRCPAGSVGVDGSGGVGARSRGVPELPLRGTWQRVLRVSGSRVAQRCEACWCCGGSDDRLSGGVARGSVGVLGVVRRAVLQRCGGGQPLHGSRGCLHRQHRCKRERGPERSGWGWAWRIW
jgi:hypothetical protein